MSENDGITVRQTVAHTMLCDVVHAFGGEKA